MSLAPDTTEFCGLLNKHFDPNEFIRLVVFTGKKITDYTTVQKPLPDMIMEVVMASQREGWYERLIQAAAFKRAEIPALTDFAQNRSLQVESQVEPKLLPIAELRQVHEIVVKRQDQWIDPGPWHVKMAEIERRICSIVIDTDDQRTVYGTGFLVGPDVMLTNYHVVEPIEKGNGQKTAGGINAKRANVRCRFDYQSAGPGASLPGSTCGLADDWLLDSSPDCMPGASPAPDQLDYALVRLDSKAGDQMIEIYPGAPAVKRGWLTPEPSYRFPADASMLILQHPGGYPLKLALDAAAILSVNDNGTRVTYSTNTEGGSSGAPCFNLSLQLVAVHHSGDQTDPARKMNVGIPFRPILDLINRRDAAKYLAAPFVYTSLSAGGVDYFKGYVMRGGRLFLGRDKFRDELRNLGQDQRSRVMAITGAPKTGKSYSVDFIRHLNGCMVRSIQPKLITLDVDANSPQDLISFLAEDLGVEKLPPNSRPDASSWLRNRVFPAIKTSLDANEKVGVWWIFLDGFRNDKYPELLEGFISEFSRAVDDDTLFPRVRLVLINYRKADTSMRKDIAEGIALKDILAFFDYANAAEGNLHSPQELQAEADQVTAQAKAECADPARADDYMRTLSEKVTESARSLFPHWMKA